MVFKAKVIVKLKDSVLDPQGQTILHALHEQGYNNLKNLRAGKIFFVEIDETSKESAEKLLSEIAHKVLSNPVIESYEVVVE